MSTYDSSAWSFKQDSNTVKEAGEKMQLRVVGVVGAGVMGTGVAQNLAQTGHRVILLDTASDALQRAKEEIEKQIRFGRLFNKAERAEGSDVAKHSRLVVSSRAAELDELVAHFRNSLMVKVDLKCNTKGKGTLVLHFNSQDELDRLYNRLVKPEEYFDEQ